MIAAIEAVCSGTRAQGTIESGDAVRRLAGWRGMRRMFSVVATVLGALSAGNGWASDVPPLDCQPGEVCQELGKQLPARVLSGPFSLIYKEKSTSQDAILSDKVAPFSPLYIFAREDIDFSNPSDTKGSLEQGEQRSGVPPLGH